MCTLETNYTIHSLTGSSTTLEPPPDDREEEEENEGGEGDRDEDELEESGDLFSGAKEFESHKQVQSIKKRIQFNLGRRSGPRWSLPHKSMSTSVDSDWV